MTKGVIEIAEIVQPDYKKIFTEGCFIEGQAILYDARRRAALLLQKTRRNRRALFQMAERDGYTVGLQQGSREAVKAFTSQSKEVRSFRRHLEQYCIDLLFELIPAVIIDHPQAVKSVSRRVLQQIRQRIKQIPICYAVCNKVVESELKSFKTDAQLSFTITTDESILPSRIRLVSAVGSIEINSTEHVLTNLRTALKRLAPNSNTLD